LALRALGHDVLTTLEAGNAGRAIPDAEVLAFASRVGRAVVTINRRDFIRLHAESAVHAGIIVCTQDADTEGQARRIDAVLAAQESLAGALLRVNRPQA
jgi:predicted nuclease of predicted toxin-antitoxin system